MPKVYAVIVKCDHNFLDFQSFDEISFVLVSGVEGRNFKPKAFSENQKLHPENEEGKIGFLIKKVCYICYLT